MSDDRQLDLLKSNRQRGLTSPSPPEFPVHCAIADMLRLRCMPGWIWWHTPNGGARNKIEGAQLKRMGTRPGVSDFLFICPPHARLYAYELKREGKKPTEEQLKFGADVIASGGVFAWGTTSKHAIATFQEWGALPTTLKVF